MQVGEGHVGASVAECGHRLCISPLVGLSLLSIRPEGFRTSDFGAQMIVLGKVVNSGYNLWIVVVSSVLISGLC